MSYAIVFSSKTGNTELLADALHSYLPQADCCYFGSPNPAAMERSTRHGSTLLIVRNLSHFSIDSSRFFRYCAGLTPYSFLNTRLK